MKSKDDIMSGYKAIFEDGYRAGRASVVLPHPCDGPLYKDCTAADYFAKMAEEHLEVIEAYKEIEKNGGDSRHFLKECTDLIIMTTSLMNYLGCDEKMRQQYMKEINESNAKRDGGKRFASSKKDFTDSEKESLFSDREIFAIKKGDTDNDKLKKQDDIIEHPAHYTQGIECMDYIESHKLNYARGNIIKYVTRAGLKDESKEGEDLEKARWYLDREIERVKKANRDG